MSKPSPFGDHDPRAWLERAGLLYLNHGCYCSAAASFSRLVSMEPFYANAWYGLGNTLYRYSGETRRVDLLKHCVACLKRAIEIEGDHEFANALLNAIPQNTPLTFDEIDTLDPLETDLEELLEEIGYDDRKFASDLNSFERSGERMQIVMWLGGMRAPFSTEILITALSDVDPDVRMAALKRLDARDRDPRVQERLQSLSCSSDAERSQPYLSMALSRFAHSKENSSWATEILKKMETDR